VHITKNHDYIVDYLSEYLDYVYDFCGPTQNHGAHPGGIGYFIFVYS